MPRKAWMSAHHKHVPVTTTEAKELLDQGYSPCPYCPYWKKVDFPCHVAAMKIMGRVY